MSDQNPVLDGTVVEQPKGTVGVTRKVNLGNYESEEISVFIQFPVTFDSEPATVQAANDAAFQAKSVVYAQLGLSVALENDILTVVKAFPGTTIEQTAAQPVEAPPTNPIPAVAPSAPAAAGDPVCPVCQSGLWDNRPKNAERVANGQKPLPEGRCKNYADPPKGTGCKGVVWNWAKGV